jgi:hypothetical protein
MRVLDQSLVEMGWWLKRVEEDWANQYRTRLEQVLEEVRRLGR